MIVMFTARRLKPGAWDQFRNAWDPGDSPPPGFRQGYHARNIRDEDEIISFGLFDMNATTTTAGGRRTTPPRTSVWTTYRHSSRTNTCPASTR